MKITELESRLKGHTQIIKFIMSAPFDLKKEINKVEEKNMIKPKNIILLRRAGVIAAMVILCVITAVSANQIKGFFKDVVRWEGAVIGTEYVNATNDIRITVSETKSNNDSLPLNIVFETSGEAPFKFIEEIAITNYKIINMNGESVFAVNTNLDNSIKCTIKDGKTLVYLPFEEADLNINDRYLIIIEDIYGLSKVDQPLRMTGTWKCEFIR